MLWLCRGLTMLTWLIWFLVHWDAGTRSYFRTSAVHHSLTASPC
jgi:hypothetical protein